MQLQIKYPLGVTIKYIYPHCTDSMSKSKIVKNVMMAVNLHYSYKIPTAYRLVIALH